MNSRMESERCIWCGLAVVHSLQIEASVRKLKRMKVIAHSSPSWYLTLLVSSTPLRRMVKCVATVEWRKLCKEEELYIDRDVAQHKCSYLAT